MPQYEPTPTDTGSVEEQPPARLLVVDDDRDVREALEQYFTMQGHDVTTAADGVRAMQLVREEPSFDLMLLDVILPEKDGFEVLREVHEAGYSTPVLMMSGRGGQEDILRGFGLGAEDYVVKPFEVDELSARIKTILGRTMPSGRGETQAYENGRLAINFGTYEAYRDGSPIDLTETEFDLLQYLVQHRGSVVTRKRLLQEAWHMDHDMILHNVSLDVLSDTIEKSIATLRRKIEPNPSEPRYIETVYGLGYRFVE